MKDSTKQQADRNVSRAKTWQRKSMTFTIYKTKLNLNKHIAVLNYQKVSKIHSWQQLHQNPHSPMMFTKP